MSSKRVLVIEGKYKRKGSKKRWKEDKNKPREEVQRERDSGRG